MAWARVVGGGVRGSWRRGGRRLSLILSGYSSRVLGSGVVLGRGLLAGLVVALALVGGVAFGEGDAGAAEQLRQMRSLLEQGYFNSAARLNGPELVARFPGVGEAHYLYARALFLTGDAAGAAASLDVAVGLLGELEPEVVNLQGLVRAELGDPDSALRALQVAFVRGREYEFAMDWGRVAWQFGRYEEAISAFEAAAGTPRGSRELWPLIDKGRLLVLLGRLDEAVETFNAAIDVFEAHDQGGSRPTPAYVEAYFRLGEAFERLGDVRRAELNYRAARTADPNYVPAVQALDRLSRSFD